MYGFERWHQTVKTGDLQRHVADFIQHYNHVRYHESLGNLTPADVYLGRAESRFLEREGIKHQISPTAALQHALHTA